MWSEMPGLKSSDEEDNNAGGNSQNSSGNREDSEYEVVETIPQPPKKPGQNVFESQNVLLTAADRKRIYADQMRAYRKERRAYKNLCIENGWDYVEQPSSAEETQEEIPAKKVPPKKSPSKFW